MSEPLTVQQAASYVLFQLDGDREQQQPGNFYEKLIEAACHADPENLAYIMQGFPALGFAVDQYKNVVGGIETLKTFAAYEPPSSH